MSELASRFRGLSDWRLAAMLIVISQPMSTCGSQAYCAFRRSANGEISGRLQAVFLGGDM